VNLRGKQKASPKDFQENIMKKLLATLTIALSAVALLAGCSTTPDPANTQEINGTDLYPIAVTLPSGSQVDCLVMNGYKAGNVTCDWKTLGNATAVPNDFSEVKGITQVIGTQTVECVMFDGYKAGGVDCNF
jgi:hypothetical protein